MLILSRVARQHWPWSSRSAACRLLLSGFGLATALAFAARAASSGSASLPAGSVLFLNLQTPVSTKTSHLKAPVTARVVRDLRDQAGDVVIPVGATVQGTIDKLIPSASATDRAKLRIKFTQVQLPSGSGLPIAAHVKDIENSRETVLDDGSVEGVLASELPITRVEGALEKIKQSNPALGAEMEKTLGTGDTSIEYPAGADLTLTLDKPLSVEKTFPPAAPEELPSAVTDAIARLLTDAPQRAQGKDGSPGDPLNLVLVGTQDQILQAFQKAGWLEAEKKSGKSVFETVRAVMANKGYGTAPVSQLYLYGRPEDFAFQKMLNTFARRHHLRIWKSPVKTSDGREVWFAAATHDIGWDLRPGVASHAIDPEIDLERDKVAADLIATGQAAAARLVTRPNPLSEGLTATGASWKTDGRLVAVVFK